VRKEDPHNNVKRERSVKNTNQVESKGIQLGNDKRRPKEEEIKCSQGDALWLSKTGGGKKKVRKSKGPSITRRCLSNFPVSVPV